MAIVAGVVLDKLTSLPDTTYCIRILLTAYCILPTAYCILTFTVGSPSRTQVRRTSRS